MDREKLIQRLMATFLAEYEEHVRALDRDLLALEKDPGAGRPELLQTLFRTVHSLKGAARSVDVGPVEAACHRMESILGAARDGLKPVGPEMIQLLLTLSDALKDTRERLLAHQDLDAGPLPALLPRLDVAMASPAPPPRPPPDPGPAPPPSSTDGLVRVPARKLDSLLAWSGELLVARRRGASRQGEISALREAVERTRTEWRQVEKPLRKVLESGSIPRRAALALERTGERLLQMQHDLELLATRTAADQHLLHQAAAPLEEELRQVRMLPFGDACEGLSRLVRDLARASGKEVELVIEGGGVELDRSILEGIKDPLVHLVRNAVDHGVEAPAERKEHGKPARGRVTVGAELCGGGVEVAVSDDGRGLDLRRIREQAGKKRLSLPESERDLARLIFLPGFSTAGIITELSGRGVGLDIVRHRVEVLHGTVDVASEPSRGSRFVLALPLTLSTMRAVLVESGGQTFALPATSVRRLIRVGAADLGSVEGHEVLLGHERPIRVVRLADVLGVKAAETRQPGGKALLAVIGDGEREVALAVDHLLATQEFVVKNLGPRLRRVRNFAGATVLPTGRIALIANAAELVETACGWAQGSAVAESLAEKSAVKKRRLLVVDDSVTTRSLEKSILEAAGYEVVVAADGAEAWRLLQENPPDLVVADVEMPRLDGFGLTEAIRGSKRFHELPVVLVTALSSEKDQARGLQAGADAYLLKSAFDQRNLLETISQLL